MGSMRSGAFQLIECNIVAREELIATMDILIHTLSKGCEELCLRQFCQFINPGVDRCSTVIDHPTLIAKDTSLHIIEIILTTFLEARDVAFLLKFLSFQIVAGIELITDSERHDIQFAQAISRVLQLIRGSHRQHLQHRVLCAVVRVLRPTLTLSYPDVLLLLGDCIRDVPTHQLTGAQHLLWRESATHRKCLVHTNQSFDPRIDEQIVTNTYLNGCGIAMSHEHHIQESRIEHNIPVVADKREAIFELRDVR